MTRPPAADQKQCRCPESESLTDMFARLQDQTEQIRVLALRRGQSGAALRAVRESRENLAFALKMHAMRSRALREYAPVAEVREAFDRFTKVIIDRVKDPDALSAILAVMTDFLDEQRVAGVKHMQEMTGSDPLLRELVAVAETADGTRQPGQRTRRAANPDQ